MLSIWGRVRCLASPGCMDFRCNVCGSRCHVPASGLGREHPGCSCGSTVRIRSLIHLLSLHFSDKSLALPDFPVRRDIAGLDMSGAESYAAGLAAKFDYINTFLHREPMLDITRPDPHWSGRYDFVISSDVFEHVAAPVQTAFANTLMLLKPGGLFLLTVPYTPEGATVEHFPRLHDYRLEQRGARRVLINRTIDHQLEEFGDLVFHGGEGETLEMRVFSREGVIAELQRAGFVDIRIHGDACPEHGIIWTQQWSLPITARRPRGG